jgi:Fe-Mn family superoxide dismutase
MAQTVNKKSRSRREFVKNSGLVIGGVATASMATYAKAAAILGPALVSCSNRGGTEVMAIETIEQKTTAFELAPLPYGYEALEPYIDAATMHLHHDKHHQTYTDNANAAVAKVPELAGKKACHILKELNSIPEALRGAVRNNVGGYYNHSFFWETMAPKGGAPAGALAAAIKTTFGDLANLQEKINDAGLKQFGSGWTWLAHGPSGLTVLSTANQDSPLTQGLIPLLGNDVWEHAYYLKYQNRRAEYLKAWWNVVNWAEVNKRYEAALKK